MFRKMIASLAVLAAGVMFASTASAQHVVHVYHGGGYHAPVVVHHYDNHPMYHPAYRPMYHQPVIVHHGYDSGAMYGCHYPFHYSGWFHRCVH